MRSYQRMQKVFAGLAWFVLCVTLGGYDLVPGGALMVLYLGGFALIWIAIDRWQKHVAVRA